ncbi:MAG: D-alanyl-D-alanine carboxypeptidase [Clostridiales bacterium]|jgi:D-alanyl-D-alanine carboxypeptidase (penicillin-binding protein 5/6)|nr:D-alanyl-D-alanine carboxypeptidase [Clostridiales bacterium]
MKKLKFLSFILILVILSANFIMPPAYALTEPTLQSKSAVLMDADTGNIIFAKSGDQKSYPASTTKIMTVLLAVEAIENGKVALTDTVTAKDDIRAGLSEDGSTAGIVPGETMTLENLLYCAMLASANEACNVIADYIGGDVGTFVGMMNTRAKELGCEGTNFTNTHGLPDVNHYTTANDLAKISYEAYSHPLFMQICSTVTKTVPATNKSDERVLKNTNGLINADSEMYSGYYYEYAAGIKTGHTQDAGYCLASTASKNNMSLICVVMGGQGINRPSGMEFTNFSDSILMYDWAFENYSYRDILETTDLIEDIPVKMGRDAEYVTVHPQNSVKALMANDEDNSSFETKVTIYSKENKEELVAPIEAGAVLGEITIERDGVVYGQSLLVACSSVDLSYSQYIKSQVVNTLKKPLVIVFILAVLALLGFYIYIVARYRTEKKRRLREIEMRRTKAMSEQQSAKDRLRSRSSILTSKYFDEDDSGKPDLNYRSKPDLNYLGENTYDKEAELKAERDYFDEFFGKNKSSK